MDKLKKYIKEHQGDIIAVGVGLVVTSVVGIGVGRYISKKDTQSVQRVMKGMQPIGADTFLRNDGASMIVVELANGRNVPLFKNGPGA